MTTTSRIDCLRGLFIGALLTVLTACSGGSGSDTQALENLNAVSATANYTGPAPHNADVQSFKLEVWDKLVADNRCGGCHGSGGQAPNFVRGDDINLAYNAAVGITDFDIPSNSRIVQKVGGGHNCWLESNIACADIVASYISAWVSQSTGGGASVVVLTPPPLKDVGSSKTFPLASANFVNTVYPVLTSYCAGCHSEDSQIKQQPYFASSDVDAAYAAAQGKIDLDNPANSRFVLRLRNEFHNCWDDCVDNADTMEAAILAFAGGIALTTPDPALVLSKALKLVDGVVASSGGRHETNVIAFYQFKTGSGNTAFDTSGVNPAIDLNLIGNVEWVGGWGIRVSDGKAQGSTSSSRKLYEQISSVGEYSIEAWVAPANVSQEGPAAIIGYSGGTTVRNFTLGQTQYNYNYLNRSTATDGNGDPMLSSADADELLQATQQHVVVTFDPVNGRRIYVNGEYTGDIDEAGGGTLVDWDDTFALVLGNEVSSDRLWQGVIRMVAIHNRALTPEQVLQNFDVGVGEKYFLLFSVAHLVDMPQSYVVFEVSQFDSYSYLFNAPFFISLDGTAQPGNIEMKGLRLGINGRELDVGQAYQNMDTAITNASYAAGGQPLSAMGTVVRLEKGPQSDEFFITFEQLGSHSNVVLEPVPPLPPPAADLPEQSDIGLRTFDEINGTMARVTTVPTTQVDVQATYDRVRQQLPTVESIEGFLSSHQMGITQLAIEYCNALVNDAGKRAAYFQGFNFGAAASAAFDTAGRSSVIDPLLLRIMASGLDTQTVPAANPAPVPLTTEVSAELNSLIDKMTACGAGCPADRTPTTVKAVCAAALGSAVMLIQ